MTRGRSPQTTLRWPFKAICPECGQPYINTGAHVERCTGPVVFKCVDPEAEYGRMVADETGGSCGG